MSNLVEQKKQRIALASKQQWMASDPRVSVWVEASAGTGKTKVLSDRVLRLLLNGTNPARILCLTYTKAAAVEMSNRIADRLSKWSVAKDEKLEKELTSLLGVELKSLAKSEEIVAQARRLFAVLLDTPGGVKIQTIHSFCQEILKRFPLEAKISPYFEIMDDRNSREAIDTIKKDMLSGNMTKETADALAFLIAEAGEFKFPTVMKSITDKRNLIDEVLQKHSKTEALIEKISEILGVGVDDTIERTVSVAWEKLNQDMVKIVIEALDKGTDSTKKTAVWLAEAFEAKNIEAIEKILFTDGRPKKKIFVKSSIEKVPYAEASLNYINIWLGDLLQKIKALKLLKATKSVLIVASELLQRYHNYKKIHSKMDYNDLIVLTKKLLEAPDVAEWILYKLDGGIDNILIDEAQDTSPEQWSIVKSLTKEFFSGQGNHLVSPTVFVVGDRKQSIYSFQGADPQEFEKMHDYFAENISDFRDVNMEVSFRSTAAVLDVVNAVFASDKAQGGVAKKGQDIAHVPSRIGDGGKVEFWPLVEPDKDDVSEKVWLPPVERISAMSASAKLAKQIAENIKKMVTSGEILQSKGRPLQYKDFLILVQRRNSFVDEMVRACKNVGVSIAGVDKIKLQEQIVVNDLIALAKFALLPDDDLNLACVLKTPILGLDDKDLFELCYGRGNSTVWQRIRENSNYLKQAEILADLCQKGKELRPFEFFAYILAKLGGRKIFVERLGPDCEDAMDEFVNLCFDFERDHIPSLQMFVEWMEGDEVEVKRNLEQSDNDAVRLMTVHGSKGLQAPIVILPDTVRVKTASQEARWLASEDVLFYPLSKDYYDDNCNMLLEKEKNSMLDEYHRLLYVALTRAEERLCVCGYRRKNTPSEECWYEICKKAFEPIALKDNDRLVYNVEQLVEPDEKKSEFRENKAVVVPDWAKKDAEKDEVLAKPLTPSHQEDDEGAVLSPLMLSNDSKLYNRGRIIHKMLQFLPNVKKENRKRAADEFLVNQLSDMPPEELEKIALEVVGLIDSGKFASLFGDNSRAEVSLMGQVDDRIVTGQIDRLVIEKDRVLIVDYKTNRPAAQTIDDVPKAYLKQMRVYRELIKRIYPDKKVETYILWTNTAKIMRIE